VGRKSTLTPELQQRLCDLIRGGNYQEVAARSCGVPVRTLRHWLRRGRQEETGIYRDFLDAVEAAETEAETSLVLAIHAGAKADLDHAWKWLERKAPQRWGRDRLKVKELERRMAELERQSRRHNEDTQP
jgi:DNA-binding transcriptional MerR regulator